MTDLDDAYANMAYIPDGASFPGRWAEAAQRFREGARWHEQSYGPGLRHRIDIFVPESAPRGLMVFIHGGYWLRFDRRDFSHLAAGAVAAGWAVAMPSYDLAPAVRVREITAEVALAVQVAARQVGGPIRICGHSAGGQLSARMLCPGVLPVDVLARVERVVPISPVSDLAPLMRTSMNADLRLDAEEARAESPVHCPAPEAPVQVWVGGAERPAFLDQARWLAEAWGCGMEVEPGRHHFDVIEGLERPSPLLEAVIG